uniref:Phorbol-ester/DAG-type domain-containing protein n=1 Tax=Davidia involucrata TaxID=16924 RepID=A0A5B7ABQ0_DAVIN
MELEHRSHKHPLILHEAQKGEAQLPDLCFVCGKRILGPAYICSQQCSFHLHKMCAELPEKIEHPKHPQHSLILHIEPYDIDCSWEYKECTVCQESWKEFTYHCSDCKFHLCISCSLEVKERRIVHGSHQHPLNLLNMPASFNCDACNIKSEDTSSYVCTACPFWIHERCASLPSTMTSSAHHHPLTLAYSLPLKYSKFEYRCQICSKRVVPTYWVYYCPRCRYFAHVNCAKSETGSVRSSDSENEIEAKDLDPNLIQLPPPPQKYIDLISHFPEKLNSGENESATEVNHLSDDQDQLKHFSHDHPLILSDVVQLQGSSKDEIQNDEIIILCDGCVLPISISAAPFYSCAQCPSFFLHKCCAQLPKMVSHPFHTKHQLSLSLHGNGDSDIADYFTCNLCKVICNGFRFNCVPCNFSLDVKCASLLGTIKHEAHKRHLIQFKSDDLPDFSSTGIFSFVGQVVKNFFSSYNLCNVCGENFSGLSLGCETCDFSLCNHHCAMLPPTVRHRYDEHPLYLSYPPFQDHPDEFYCEICEEEIDPNLWMYHCRDCDQSFHTKCIYKVEETLNFKFGETFKARNHPHPLTVVRENKRQSWCDRCSKYFDYKPAFECAPCNTIVCHQCILYGDARVSVEDIS